MRLKTAEELVGLAAWGGWARGPAGGVGLRPPGWTKLYIAGYRSSESAFRCTDDEGAFMDSLVLAAPQPLREMALLYYVNGLPLRKVAQNLKTSIRDVNDRRVSMVNFVARRKGLRIPE